MCKKAEEYKMKMPLKVCNFTLDNVILCHSLSFVSKEIDFFNFSLNRVFDLSYYLTVFFFF